MLAWKGDPPKSIAPEDRLSAHFKAGEFYRAADPWPPEWYDRLLRLVYGPLEDVRIALDCPLFILSGYRSPEHNAHTPGSAKHSQHCCGRAVDFRMTPRGGTVAFANQKTKEAHSYLIEHADRLGIGAIGWYRPTDYQPRARVHVDLRWRPPGGRLARWTKDA